MPSRSSTLPHPDDSPGTDFDALAAYMRQRVNTVLQRAGGNDLVVEFGRGIDIMIVEVQSGGGEPLCLFRCQHAERDACFHAEILHRSDHVADLVEVAGFWAPPGSRHAEARRHPWRDLRRQRHRPDPSAALP